MMYSEFIEGTKCKANAHNYEVFEAIEKLYNITEGMTKEDAYKMAKKFLDNSLTEEQKRHNEEVNAEIELNKSYIDSETRNIAYYRYEMEMAQIDHRTEAVKEYRKSIKSSNEWIMSYKNKIETLKTCLYK